MLDNTRLAVLTTRDTQRDGLATRAVEGRPPSSSCTYIASLRMELVKLLA